MYPDAAVIVGVVILHVPLVDHIVHDALVAPILLAAFLSKFQLKLLEFNAYHVFPVLLVVSVILVTPAVVWLALVPQFCEVKLVCAVIVGSVGVQLVCVLYIVHLLLVALIALTVFLLKFATNSLLVIVLYVAFALTFFAVFESHCDVVALLSVLYPIIV